MPESVGAKTQVIPLLAIVFLYGAAALLVDPRGEFPLNDDWSYTRSAFKFGTGSGMHIDEWSAPSLVGQAIYGGIVIRIFGPSFTALRVSTAVLSCGVALILWFILSLMDVRPAVRWAAVLSWIFNPVQFCLAFTFMTEVPFLFFVTLAFLLFALHLRSRSVIALGGCAAMFGYAFLIRQIAVLFMAPVLLVLLTSPLHSWRRRLQSSAVFAPICSLFIVAYNTWVLSTGGSTPATRRKYELLRQLTIDQVAGNSFGILFYVAFMLLPLVAAVLPYLWRARSEVAGPSRVWWPAAWGIAAAAGLAWFARYALPVYLPGKAFHSRMPFLLNVLYDTGLGPVTLDPTYYGSPETPIYPGAWRVVTILVAAAVIPLGSALALGLIRAWRQRQSDSVRFPLVASAALGLVALAGFEVIFSHTQEGGLFDRHILTLALPTLLLVSLVVSRGGSTGTQPNGAPARAGSTVATVIAAVLAWFCVAATHDYLAWNRIRWDFGRGLISSGVNPLNASCGFEFNAWYNYDAFRARGNIEKIYYWWYDDEEYVIAMARQEGYNVVRQQSYNSWVHRRPVPLFLLCRIRE